VIYAIYVVCLNGWRLIVKKISMIFWRVLSFCQSFCEYKINVWEISVFVFSKILHYSPPVVYKCKPILTKTETSGIKVFSISIDLLICSDRMHQIRTFYFNKIRFSFVAIQQWIIAFCMLVGNQTAINSVFRKKI
jgi:hypothetical protein